MLGRATARRSPPCRTRDRLCDTVLRAAARKNQRAALLPAPMLCKSAYRAAARLSKRLVGGSTGSCDRGSAGRRRDAGRGSCLIALLPSGRRHRLRQAGSSRHEQPFAGANGMSAMRLRAPPAESVLARSTPTAAHASGKTRPRPWPLCDVPAEPLLARPAWSRHDRRSDQSRCARYRHFAEIVPGGGRPWFFRAAAPQGTAQRRSRT